MNRRRFLFVTGATGLVGYSGCIGIRNRSNDNSDGTETADSSTGEPAVDGDEPELAAGEATTVTVEANNITDLYFSGLPNGEVIEFAVNRASVSPPPEGGADSYPPRWSWSSRTSVTVDVPVTVADDAKPGEYPYEVTFLTDNDTSTKSTEEFAITVIEN